MDHLYDIHRQHLITCTKLDNQEACLGKTTAIKIQHHHHNHYLHNKNSGLLGLTVCYAGILFILPQASGPKQVNMDDKDI